MIHQAVATSHEMILTGVLDTLAMSETINHLLCTELWLVPRKILLVPQKSLAISHQQMSALLIRY